MFLAEDLVASGGPSAPVWAFFTAISLGLIGLFGQQIVAKREARSARDEATKAANSAEQAQANTVNVSNGFVGRMDRKLDAITKNQQETNDALRRHLEWHMEKENN